MQYKGKFISFISEVHHPTPDSRGISNKINEALKSVSGKTIRKISIEYDEKGSSKIFIEYYEIDIEKFRKKPKRIQIRQFLEDYLNCDKSDAELAIEKIYYSNGKWFVEVYHKKGEEFNNCNYREVSIAREKLADFFNSEIKIKMIQRKENT